MAIFLVNTKKMPTLPTLPTLGAGLRNECLFHHICPKTCKALIDSLIRIIATQAGTAFDDFF